MDERRRVSDAQAERGDASRSAPAVTVTVCNYNGEAYLADCLESVRRQTYPVREVVLYDNASSDGGLKLVRERFPEVRVVESGENQGPGPARNRGLDEAGTDWVLQVDNDVVLEDDCLEKLVAQIGDPEVALIVPRAVFASDPGTVHYDGGWFHYIGVMSLRHFFQPRPAGPEEAVDVDAAISMALLVRRAPVHEIGGYHAGYFILFEDHDLSYRLRSAGHRIRLEPNAVVRHLAGTPGISWREGKDYPWRRTFLHSRNRWMLLLRNHSWPALLIGAPGIAFYELVSIGFALLQGNGTAWLRGKIELVPRLAELCRERREIQARRRVSDSRLLGARSLTHAPMVAQGGLLKALESGIDRVLRFWWTLVRWTLGCR